MSGSTANDNHGDRPEDGSSPDRPGARSTPVSDESARRALDEGDHEKIDRTLDELDVSTTKSGKDQSGRPDTEGSNSSSKNLDEQDD